MPVPGPLRKARACGPTGRASPSDQGLQKGSHNTLGAPPGEGNRDRDATVTTFSVTGGERS